MKTMRDITLLEMAFKDATIASLREQVAELKVALDYRNAALRAAPASQHNVFGYVTRPAVQLMTNEDYPPCGYRNLIIYAAPRKSYVMPIGLLTNAKEPS